MDTSETLHLAQSYGTSDIENRPLRLFPSRTKTPKVRVFESPAATKLGWLTPNEEDEAVAAEKRIFQSFQDDGRQMEKLFWVKATRKRRGFMKSLLPAKVEKPGSTLETNPPFVSQTKGVEKAISCNEEEQSDERGTPLTQCRKESLVCVTKPSVASRNQSNEPQPRGWVGLISPMKALRFKNSTSTSTPTSTEHKRKQSISETESEHRSRSSRQARNLRGQISRTYSKQRYERKTAASGRGPGQKERFESWSRISREGQQQQRRSPLVKAPSKSSVPSSTSQDDASSPDLLPPELGQQRRPTLTGAFSSPAISASTSPNESTKPNELNNSPFSTSHSFPFGDSTSRHRFGRTVLPKQRPLSVGKVSCIQPPSYLRDISSRQQSGLRQPRIFSGNSASPTIPNAATQDSTAGKRDSGDQTEPTPTAEVEVVTPDESALPSSSQDEPLSLPSSRIPTVILDAFPLPPGYSRRPSLPPAWSTLIVSTTTEQDESATSPISPTSTESEYNSRRMSKVASQKGIRPFSLSHGTPRVGSQRSVRSQKSLRPLTLARHTSLPLEAVRQEYTPGDITSNQQPSSPAMDKETSQAVTSSPTRQTYKRQSPLTDIVATSSVPENTSSSSQATLKQTTTDSTQLTKSSSPEQPLQQNVVSLARFPLKMKHRLDQDDNAQRLQVEISHPESSMQKLPALEDTSCSSTPSAPSSLARRKSTEHQRISGLHLTVPKAPSLKTESSRHASYGSSISGLSSAYGSTLSHANAFSPTGFWGSQDQRFAPKLEEIERWQRSIRSDNWRSSILGKEEESTQMDIFSALRDIDPRPHPSGAASNSRGRIKFEVTPRRPALMKGKSERSSSASSKKVSFGVESESRVFGLMPKRRSSLAFLTSALDVPTETPTTSKNQKEWFDFSSEGASPTNAAIQLGRKLVSLVQERKNSPQLIPHSTKSAARKSSLGTESTGSLLECDHPRKSPSPFLTPPNNDSRTKLRKKSSFNLFNQSAEAGVEKFANWWSPKHSSGGSGSNQPSFGSTSKSDSFRASLGSSKLNRSSASSDHSSCDQLFSAADFLASLGRTSIKASGDAHPFPDFEKPDDVAVQKSHKEVLDALVSYWFSQAAPELDIGASTTSLVPLPAEPLGRPTLRNKASTFLLSESPARPSLRKKTSSWRIFSKHASSDLIDGQETVVESAPKIVSELPRQLQSKKKRKETLSYKKPDMDSIVERVLQTTRIVLCQMLEGFGRKKYPTFGAYLAVRPNVVSGEIAKIDRFEAQGLEQYSVKNQHDLQNLDELFIVKDAQRWADPKNLGRSLVLEFETILDQQRTMLQMVLGRRKSKELRLPDAGLRVIWATKYVEWATEKYEQAKQGSEVDMKNWKDKRYATNPEGTAACQDSDSDHSDDDLLYPTILKKIEDDADEACQELGTQSCGAVNSPTRPLTKKDESPAEAKKRRRLTTFNAGLQHPDADALPQETQLAMRKVKAIEEEKHEWEDQMKQGEEKEKQRIQEQQELRGSVRRTLLRKPTMESVREDE